MNNRRIKYSVKLYDNLQRTLAWAETKRQETPPISSKAKVLLKVCGVIIILGVILYGATYLIPV